MSMVTGEGRRGGVMIRGGSRKRSGETRWRRDTLILMKDTLHFFADHKIEFFWLRHSWAPVVCKYKSLAMKNCSWYL